MMLFLYVMCLVFGGLFLAAGFKLAVMRKPGPAVMSLVIAGVWFVLSVFVAHG